MQDANVHQIFLGNLDNTDKRASKDKRNRLSSYIDWLLKMGGAWYRPDLKAYQEVLIDQRGLSPTSAKAHLSTIRARYRALIKDSSIREHLRREFPSSSDDTGLQHTIDWIIQDIQTGINPRRTRIEIEPVNTDYLRLTKEQAEQLIAAPGLDSLNGLRDTFLIALMLCTGIRVIEASNLRVEDLNSQLEDGQTALHVPKARGCIERLIPYGNLKWILELGREWITAVEISSGPLLRGFYKSSKSVRPTPLKSNAIIEIVNSHPLITVDDEPIMVAPMDLRRTYAQRLYEEGIDIVTLQEYLGLQSANSVIDYIGKTTVQAQQSSTAIIPKIFSFQSFE